MGIGSAGAHFRRDPDRFHQFSVRSALSKCGLGVASDAVRTLGYVSDGNCTQDASLGDQSRTGGTNPAAGTVVNRNTGITVDYSAANCGGGGGGGGRGNNGNGDG